jgi:hypothetical protein
MALCVACGIVAERTDVRGVTFRHRYDGLEQLASVEVGEYIGADSVSGYPASLNPPGGGGVPVDRVGFVEYQNHDRGHLETVTAHSSVGVRSEHCCYDGMGATSSPCAKRPRRGRMPARAASLSS